MRPNETYVQLLPKINVATSEIFYKHYSQFFTTLFSIDAAFAMCLLPLRSDDTKTRRFCSHSETFNLILCSVVKLPIEYSYLRFLLPKCIIFHLLELNFISHSLVHIVTESMSLCRDSTLDSSSIILIILLSSAYS